MLRDPIAGKHALGAFTGLLPVALGEQPHQSRLASGQAIAFGSVVPKRSNTAPETNVYSTYESGSHSYSSHHVISDRPSPGFSVSFFRPSSPSRLPGRARLQLGFRVRSLPPGSLA